MDSIQTIWDKTKKTAQFVGRHFFTLAIVGILISAFIEAPLNWRNAFFMITTSIFLDWVKQFIKPNFKLHSRMPYSSYDDISLPLYKRQPWNPSIIGTSAYESDNYPRIKYD